MYLVSYRRLQKDLLRRRRKKSSTEAPTYLSVSVDDPFSKIERSSGRAVLPELLLGFDDPQKSGDDVTLVAPDRGWFCGWAFVVIARALDLSPAGSSMAAVSKEPRHGSEEEEDGQSGRRYPAHVCGGTGSTQSRSYPRAGAPSPDLF